MDPVSYQALENGVLTPVYVPPVPIAQQCDGVFQEARHNSSCGLSINVISTMNELHSFAKSINNLDGLFMDLQGVYIRPNRINSAGYGSVHLLTILVIPRLETFIIDLAALRRQNTGFMTARPSSSNNRSLRDILTSPRIFKYAWDMIFLTKVFELVYKIPLMSASTAAMQEVKTYSSMIEAYHAIIPPFPPGTPLPSSDPATSLRGRRLTLTVTPTVEASLIPNLNLALRPSHDQDLRSYCYYRVHHVHYLVSVGEFLRNQIPPDLRLDIFGRRSRLSRSSIGDNGDNGNDNDNDNDNDNNLDSTHRRREQSISINSRFRLEILVWRAFYDEEVHPYLESSSTQQENDNGTTSNFHPRPHRSPPDPNAVPLLLPHLRTYPLRIPPKLARTGDGRYIGVGKEARQTTTQTRDDTRANRLSFPCTALLRRVIIREKVRVKSIRRRRLSRQSVTSTQLKELFDRRRWGWSSITEHVKLMATTGDEELAWRLREGIREHEQESSNPCRSLGKPRMRRIRRKIPKPLHVMNVIVEEEEEQGQQEQSQPQQSEQRQQLEGGRGDDYDGGDEGKDEGDKEENEEKATNETNNDNGYHRELHHCCVFEDDLYGSSSSSSTSPSSPLLIPSSRYYYSSIDEVLFSFSSSPSSPSPSSSSSSSSSSSFSGRLLSRSQQQQQQQLEGCDGDSSNPDSSDEEIVVFYDAIEYQNDADADADADVDEDDEPQDYPEEMEEEDEQQEEEKGEGEREKQQSWGERIWNRLSAIYYPAATVGQTYGLTTTERGGGGGGGGGGGVYGYDISP